MSTKSVAGIAVGSNEAGPEQSNGTGTNGASNTTPAIIKDDKMEVDSEGCPLGAPAEQGGAPTTPTKPKAYSK